MKDNLWKMTEVFLLVEGYHLDGLTYKNTYSFVSFEHLPNASNSQVR